MLKLIGKAILTIARRDIYLSEAMIRDKYHYISLVGPFVDAYFSYLDILESVCNTI